jgi:predicted dehydrogenase
MIKVGVIGAGHFGRQHARIYTEMEDAQLVAIVDVEESSGRPVAEACGAEFFPDHRQLIGRVDAVSLAAPTLHHCLLACDLLGQGISVLVEKPMASTIEEADRMIAAAAMSSAVLQVGHLERFNPAVTAAKQIATTPRFFEAHRLSVFTPRSLDVDVVMDLMIHDIDVVLSLVGSDVAEVRAAGVPVLTPMVDIANARIEFQNGAVANLTASRVSGERTRKLRFFQPREYISIDYSAQEASMVSVNPAEGGRPQFEARLLRVERAEPLRLEIEAFLRSVAGEPIVVSGLEGRRALEVAVEINNQIREHALRAGVNFPARAD